MTTKLAAPLKREIEIGGKPYTLTVTAEGFKLVPKGRRKGHELTWDAIIGVTRRSPRPSTHRFSDIAMS